MSVDKQAMLQQCESQITRTREALIRLDGYRMAIADMIKAEAEDAAKQPENSNVDAAT